MPIDLRIEMNNGLNLDITSKLMSDTVLDATYNEVDKFWTLYRRSNDKFIAIAVSSSNFFTFTDPIPETITCILETSTGEVTTNDWIYAKPTLSILEGEYSVLYESSTTSTELDEFLHDLFRRLFIAISKRKLGQRVKFSKFQDAGFELDGDALYDEGKEEETSLREFIILNRDEPKEIY